jgi:DNA-binding response OmpR family regulator
VILFVDDERRHIDSYTDDLTRSGYDVVYRPGVDNAVHYFDANSAEIRLVILDLMMSPGKTFENVDTDDGLRTGVHFYYRVREKVPELPVIILTNVNEDDVRAIFEGDENCWYFEKEHYLPYEITQEVKRIYPPKQQ